MRTWKLGLALLACMAVVACGDDSDGSTDTGMTTDPGTAPGDMNMDDSPSLPMPGEDSTDPSTGGGGDTGGDTDGDGLEIPDEESSGGDPYPECPREMIETPPPFDGAKPAWTQEEFMACQQTCGMDQSCFTEENCPGLDNFDLCANSEIFACSANDAGACRLEYENVVCCINIAGCAGDDIECAQLNCGADITAMQTCIQADMPCLQQAVGACIAPAGTGANMVPAAASMGIQSRGALEQVLLQTAL